MAPILFSIGGFQVYSSVVFLVLAILAGLIVGRIESRRLGISARDFYLYSITVVPIGLLLAALNGLVFEIVLWNLVENYAFTGSSGLVSYGAVVGALAWGHIFTRAVKGPVPERLDLIAVTIPLILGIYRIGCLLNGCCHGREIGETLAFDFLSNHGDSVARYPTQVMLMLMNFGLFAWLWWRRKRKSFDGELALLFLILYSLGRLIIDGLRELPAVLGPLSLHQLSELLILLIAIGAFVYVRKRDVIEKG
jgi:phosphatidylglycerol:prolipoprotein diacylglycerol transferase